MAAVMSTLRMKNLTRFSRYFLLLVISRLLLKYKVHEYFFPSSQSKTTKLKNFREPGHAVIKSNWFLYKIFGHLAELKPWIWTPEGIMSYKLLQQRYSWYEANKENKSGAPSNASVSVKIMAEPFVFSRDLSLVQGIHGKEQYLFRNSDSIRKAWGKLFPNSMAVITGEHWIKVRRVFVSAMSKLDYQHLPISTFNVLDSGLNNFLKFKPEDVGAQREVGLWDLFSRITFDSFHKFMYDINFNTLSGENEHILQCLRTIASKISDRMFIYMPILWHLPLERNRLLYRCRDTLYAFIDGHIKKRTEEFLKDKNSIVYQISSQTREPRTIEEKEEEEANERTTTSPKFNNLLDAMILSKYEEETKLKKKLNHKEIRSQLVASMFGGFDTTTSSMSFLAMTLAKHPEYQEKLYADIKNLDLSKVQKKTLNEIKMLNGIIKEVQRLQPVADMIVRVPNEDVVIGDTLLKGNTNVFLDNYEFGREPKYWQNAQDLDKFRPERWFNFEPAKGVFSPFGFGARKCPGYKVADTQMQVILCYLVQNYKILPANKPVELRCSLGMTVSPDSSIIIEKR